MAKISVIVPVYQAQELLNKCVTSVIEQTFTDWELLLINDGSKDNSASICDEFAKKDPRIIVTHQENAGVSVARNKGLMQATGEYIAFLDSDDWFEPDAFELLINEILNNQADTAGCAHFNIQPNGQKEIEKPALKQGVYGENEILEGIVNRLIGDRLAKPSEVLNGFIWRFLFSRSIITENNITFEGAYLEDEIFLLNYFCYAKKLAIIDKPLYYYLQNPVSVTRTYMKNYEDTFSRFFEQKKEIVKKYNLGEKNIGWEHNTNWAGLIIAIGNEYAKSNKASIFEKHKKVISITKKSPMKEAIRNLKPQGLGRNKQIVVDLVRNKMFLPLTMLYLIKNR